MFQKKRKETDQHNNQKIKPKYTSRAPGPVVRSLGFIGDTRRPTYTCPNPPFPNFLSILYNGDPPT